MKRRINALRVVAPALLLAVAATVGVNQHPASAGSQNRQEYYIVWQQNISRSTAESDVLQAGGRVQHHHDYGNSSLISVPPKRLRHSCVITHTFSR